MEADHVFGSGRSSQCASPGEQLRSLRIAEIEFDLNLEFGYKFN